MKLLERIKRVSVIIVAVILCSANLCAAQDSFNYAESSEKRYGELLQALQQEREKPLQELIVKTAMARLGAEYVASTLEEVPERLIVDLNRTDCILFVESTIALAQIIKEGKSSYSDLCNKIQQLRYRDGVVNGYASRLHYTSEWIRQAEKNGVLKEISGSISGIELNQKFSFMSRHRERYPQLANSDSNLAEIKKAEERLNNGEYFYIPRERLQEFSKEIKSGDIICFCTSVEGLDISHVAIALWQGGSLTFIHASMGAMKVIIEPRTMQEYLNSGKSNIGIRVLRATF